MINIFRKGKKEKSENPEIEPILNDARKLKALITFIVYGLLMLMIKLFYETVIDIPSFSLTTVIILLAYSTTIVFFFIHRFSRNVIQKITDFTISIQEERNFAESLINTIPDPLLIMNANMEIILVNRSLSHYLNLGEKKIQGQVFSDILPKSETNAELIKPLLEIGAKEINFDNIEKKIELSPGKESTVLISARQTTRKKEKIIILSLKDISNLKNVENQLKEKTTQIEIANRAKSDFLANMSHELRTPLNAIIGFSEILKEGITGDPVSEKQYEYLQEIFVNGHHLLTLINDILDLSKIEAGKMTLFIEKCHLPFILQNSLSIVKERAFNHDIQLSTEISSEIGEVFVDETKIKQILFNLLSNAIKFTPDGGKVLLSARIIPYYQLKVETANAESEGKMADLLEISVTDTGIGISQKDIPLLFKPFIQLDSSLSRHYKGTGLGLSMVKKLTELHGGQVIIKSKLGQGSTFSIQIPLSAKSPQIDE